ncbi:proline-rich protein 29 isoform X3 [Mauremys mutica]|uniref:proline-rich protein 29 isoform X3 n=1 Tax=Mauremys mutica TaxID=74926 RepID=UPI001D16BE40|nr:proline-rich protein 29 isoform X3 [Mauremys mutica]
MCGQLWGSQVLITQAGLPFAVVRRSGHCVSSCSSTPLPGLLVTASALRRPCVLGSLMGPRLGRRLGMQGPVRRQRVIEGCPVLRPHRHACAGGLQQAGSVLSGIPQQPMTIFQQIPGILSPFTQPVRPGHVREDLIELMMIQNAQMHQVIMSNMTMAALTSFGFSPAPAAAQQHRTQLGTCDRFSAPSLTCTAGKGQTPAPRPSPGGCKESCSPHGATPQAHCLAEGTCCPGPPRTPETNGLAAERSSQKSGNAQVTRRKL